jgi:hypothetical protein
MDEKKRVIITIIISILALTILTVMVNKNLVGQGSFGDASKENEQNCNDWCDQQIHCGHCSTLYDCGEDYTGVKHWTGYGKNWHACEKRTTVNRFWEQRPKLTSKQDTLVISLGGASTFGSGGDGESNFLWFCEDFFYVNGNKNQPKYENVYCFSSYAGVHTNSGILSNRIAELAEEMEELSGKPTKIFLIGKSMGGCKLHHAVSGTDAAIDDDLQYKDIDYFVGIDMSCKKNEGITDGYWLNFKDNVQGLVVFYQKKQSDHNGYGGYIFDKNVALKFNVDVNHDSWNVFQNKKLENVTNPLCSGVTHSSIDTCGKLKETIQEMVLTIAYEEHCNSILNKNDCDNAYSNGESDHSCFWSTETGRCEAQPEVCYDGKDNDNDGDIDSWDFDCKGATSTTGSQGSELEGAIEVCSNEFDEKTQEVIQAGCTSEITYSPDFCFDNKDNDKDGLTDCDDPDCVEGTEDCTKGTEFKFDGNVLSDKGDKAVTSGIANYPVDGVNQAVELKESKLAYVKFPNELLDGLVDFTVMMWVKTAGTGGKPDAILSAANSKTSKGDNEFIIYNPKDLTIYVKGKAVKTTTSLNLADDKWHHIAVTRDNEILKVYYDGIHKGILGVDGGPLNVESLILGQEQDINKASTQTSVGNNLYIDSGQAFKGRIDEIKFYKYALGKDEIKKIAVEETLAILLK